MNWKSLAIVIPILIAGCETVPEVPDSSPCLRYIVAGDGESSEGCCTAHPINEGFTLGDYE